MLHAYVALTYQRNIVKLILVGDVVKKLFEVDC